MKSMLEIAVVFVAVFVTTITFTSALPSIKDVDTDPWKSLAFPELDPKEKDPLYWRNQARATLEQKTKQEINRNTAKNIIFFIGDGMSVSTVTATRIYQGQLNNRTGEENMLFFEKFPHTGLSKTYCADRQVPDSASTATAYMCGVKSNFRTIGVSAKVQSNDCDSAKMHANHVTSIVEWAQKAGKATGVVTTTRVTHASPAGSYAHVNHRDMESDADVKDLGLDPKICDFDIAKQLVRTDPGRNIKVVLGGGRNKFLPLSGSQHGKGIRSDVDLVEEWLKDKKKPNAAFVSSADELKNVSSLNTDYLLGLFSDDHLHYHLENKTDEPRLWEMTETAIKILQKEEKGFYLFVEGGKIDMAHHEGKARMALDETMEFSKAVQKAFEMTNEQETLIVVTADHSHTMTISGYAARGYDILNIFGKSSDGLPYSTLSYANGPGYHPQSKNGTRYNLEFDHFASYDYVFPSMTPKKSETHGGDDVAVYANGPWSHLFSGIYEQNFIPLAKAHAAQIVPTSSHEPSANSSSVLTTNFSTISILSPIFVCLFGYKFVL